MIVITSVVKIYNIIQIIILLYVYIISSIIQLDKTMRKPDLITIPRLDYNFQSSTNPQRFVEKGVFNNEQD